MKKLTIRNGMIVALLLGLMSILAIGCASGDAPATPTPSLEPTPEPSPTEEPTAADEETPEALPEVDQDQVAASVDAALAQIDPPDGELVAEVNDGSITWEHYRQFLRLRLLTLSSQQTIDWESEEGQEQLRQIAQQILQQLIDMELLRQEAAAQDMLPTEDEIAKLEEEIKTQLMASEEFEDWDDYRSQLGMSEELFRQIIQESLILDDMMALHGDPGEKEQVHLYHILVSDQETADEVLDKLDEGDEFSALAQEYSEDDETAAEGGELGWFPQGFMSPDLEQKAWSMEVGDVSEAISSTRGYHILKVTEREERPLDPAFAEAFGQEAFSGWLQTVREDAQIETFILNDR